MGIETMMNIETICLIICLAILGISGLIFTLHGTMLQKEWEKWKTDDDSCSSGEQKDEYESIFRCKDCKLNGTWFCPVNEQAGVIMTMDDNNYCSWGKRKNGVAE